MATATLTNIGGRKDNSSTTVRMGASSGGVVYDDACWKFTVPADSSISSYSTISFTLKWNSDNFKKSKSGYTVGITTVSSTGTGSGDQHSDGKNIYQITSGVLKKATYTLGSTDDSRSHTFTFTGLTLKPGTTYYIRANNSNSSTYKNVYTDAGSVTLSGITYAYSNCTAPSSVSISSTSTTQGGSVTVSWSGARGGTSNPISKYRVFLQYNDANVSSSNYYKYYDTTDSSYEFSTSRDIGTSYNFVVYAIGSVSGYNSGPSSVVKTTVVNSAPTLSSVSLDYTVLPYTGGTVEATFNASDPNTSTQTIKYQYKIGSSGTWSTLSTSKTQSIAISGISQSATSNTTRTIYFRANDGVANSGEKSLSVTVRHSPQLGLTITPSEQQTCVNGEDGKYYKKYKITLSNTATSSGTYTYYLMTGDTKKTLGTSTANSYTCDITSYSGQTGKYIYFGASFVEELGYGDNSSKTFWADSNQYFIPVYFTSVNTIIHNDKELEKTVLGGKYFNNKIKFCFYNSSNKPYTDTGIKYEAAYSTDTTSENDEKTWTSFNSSLLTGSSPMGKSLEIDTSSLKAGTKYCFRIKQRRGSGSAGTYYSSVFTKIKSIDLASLGFYTDDGVSGKFNTTGETIYPHRYYYNTATKEFEVNTFVPTAGTQFIGIKKTALDNLNQYGLEDLSTIYLKTKRTSNTSIGTVGKEYDLTKLSSFGSNNYLYKYSLEDSYYNKKVDIEENTDFYGITNYVSVHTIKFWLEGTDIFGNTLTSSEISLKLEFRLPTVIDNLKIEDFSVEELKGNLYEAQSLSISAICGYFSNDWHTFTPTISLNNSLIKTFDTIYPLNGNGQILKLGKPIEIEFSGNFSLPSFSKKEDNKNFVFSIQSDDTNKTISTSTYGNYTIIKQTNTDNQLKIAKGEYNKKNENEISFSYTSGDLGISTVSGFNLEVKALYSTDINFDSEVTEVLLSNNFESYRDKTNASISFIPDSEKWTSSFYYMRLIITTTNPYGKEYELKTNTLVIYNISPTLSYRKNQLGINHSIKNDEQKDALLIIGEHSDEGVTKNKIIYLGAGDSYGMLEGFGASGGTWT